MAANLGRMISDYRGLIETCRSRADELGISRLEIDRLGGLPSGYSGKLLGKDGGEPGRKNKKMWPVALESMLGVLGLRVLLIEDDAATKRTLAFRVPVDHCNQRFDNKCNSPKQLPKIAAPLGKEPDKPMIISAALNEDAKINTSRAHLRVVQSKRRGSKYG